MKKLFKCDNCHSYVNIHLTHVMCTISRVFRFFMSCFSCFRFLSDWSFTHNTKEQKIEKKMNKNNINMKNKNENQFFCSCLLQSDEAQRSFIIFVFQFFFSVVNVFICFITLATLNWNHRYILCHYQQSYSFAGVSNSNCC